MDLTSTRLRRRHRADRAEPPEGADDDYREEVFTPLIDIFVSIVFFLMVGFTATGELVSVPPDVDLPNASADPALEGLTVGISPEWITLAGENLVSFEEAVASFPPDEPQLIPALHDRLSEIHEAVRRRSGSGEAGPSVLAVQGDRRIPYAVLSRVVYSARKAGFTTFSLHVAEPEGGAAVAEAPDA